MIYPRLQLTGSQFSKVPLLHSVGEDRSPPRSLLDPSPPVGDDWSLMNRSSV